MHLLEELWPAGSAAGGLAILSMAVTLGLGLGAIRIHGFKLGISGVLFSALVFGQLGLSVDPAVLRFLRDFSLIMFVYTIGLQVGPGFVDSLKSEGLRLNLLAIAVLVLGALMTAAVVEIAHLSGNSATGLFAGAFTTTAGLAAGQEALSRMMRTDGPRMAGLAYAVTYPFGMIGPALSIALVRRIFRVDVKAELEALAERRRPQAGFVDLEITNSELEGVALKELVPARQDNVLFSRMLHNQVLSVPSAETKIAVGDVFRALGNKPALDRLVTHAGRVSPINLATVSGDLHRAVLLVTRTNVLRKPLRELDLINRHGVTLARITRAGVELIPTASTHLHFGDIVVVVGPAASVAAMEDELGNSRQAVNRPQLVPIFLGIALGVLVGSIPIAIPGISGGIRLGLASGPMLVAIALSRLGNIGSIVWHMPVAANTLFRDFGLAVFLACVGLQQGDHFVQKVVSGGGLELIAAGAFLTMGPLILVAIAARKFLKMNFIVLSGWAAGAMTSTPALLFAGELTQSDAPAHAYAAVAPLAFIVPIFCCQFLAAVR